MLNILSYNIQYGKNLKEIVNWIKGLKISPDIICFQEFPEHELSNLNLPDYKYISIPGWERFGKIFGQLTLYKKNNFSILKHKPVDFGLRKLEKTLLKMSGRRNALLTTFKSAEGKILIANIHLPWLGLNSIRREKLGLITKDLADESMPVLIIGDFNYSSLFNRKGLVEFMSTKNFKLAGEYMVTHKLYIVNPKLKVLPQQLDYAFFRGLEIKDIKVCNVDYSDHYPIFLRVGSL